MLVLMRLISDGIPSRNHRIPSQSKDISQLPYGKNNPFLIQGKNAIRDFKLVEIARTHGLQPLLENVGGWIL